MQLNPNKITEKAGEIYEKLGEAYEFKDGLRSNQVRAAIIAICEEINKQELEREYPASRADKIYK